MTAANLVHVSPRLMLEIGPAIVALAEQIFLLQIHGKRRAYDPTLGSAYVIYKSYRNGAEVQDGAPAPLDPGAQAVLASVRALFEHHVGAGNDVIVWRRMPDGDDSHFRCAFMPFSSLSPRHLTAEEI